MLGSFPDNGLKTSSENSKENLNQGENRQAISRTESLTTFMILKEGYSKRVTFDTTDGIEQKIGKLAVMMGKLVTEDEGQNRQFKPQVYQSKWRYRIDQMQLGTEKIPG